MPNGTWFVPGASCQRPTVIRTPARCRTQIKRSAYEEAHEVYLPQAVTITA